MEDRTIPFRIYEHLIVHPKIKSYKWSIIVYSSIGTPKQLRGSFYTGRPEHAKPFLLPSSPCPFESGRRCLVQLYDGHVWAAFRDDRDRLTHASSGRMVAHIISNSRQFYSVHHSLGRVYVRSAGSLFIWADSPDEVVKSVDRILALAPERAEDELSEFFDFNALSAEEDLKISPPAQDVYNPSALSDPSNAAKEFQQAEVSRYFDSSPVVVPPALLSSPFSLSASPLSFPDVSNFMDLSQSASTSATASPAYLSATLCPGDAFGLPSSKGRWADAFDSILDIDLPRIALAKQCTVSGANCAEMANTLGAPEIPVLPDTVSAQYTPLLPTVAPAPSRSPRLNDVKRTTSKSKANQTRKPSSRRAVKKNVCEHCGANFTRAQDLERHVNSSCTAAPVDVRKPRPRHICELCGETLSRKDAAIRHMNNESCFSKRRKRNNPSVY